MEWNGMEWNGIVEIRQSQMTKNQITSPSRISQRLSVLAFVLIQPDRKPPSSIHISQLIRKQKCLRI